uniref:class I SAM-dependent methyltransferase n=1 Tax=Methylomonas sp. PHL2-19 TaxID=3438878 RepID=UPI00402B28D9
MIEDVPSPIDLRLEEDARQWSELAMVRRPWRTEFFSAMASAIQAASQGQPCRVLELGSGPGFLAEHLLQSLPFVTLVALDFSPPMHQLALQRLGPLAARVQFVERSFREPDWSEGLGKFDHVVTNQAVHELRHKHHAPPLHAQVRACLVAGGSYLVSDHYFGEGGMSNHQLYMSAAEQRAALSGAGFAVVEQLLLKGGMVLHRAT